MKHYASLIGSVLLFVTVAQVLNEGDAKSQQNKIPKVLAAQVNGSETKRIINLLNEELDIGIYRRIPLMKLPEFLKLLQSNINATNEEVRIFLNVNQFRLEDPDGPQIIETELSVHKLPRRVSLAAILRFALSNHTPNNATFIVRRGMIEITTKNSTQPQALLAQPVTAAFSNVPLANALEKLSDQTGAAIVLDPRSGERINTRVTATFANNVALETALITLTDMADLKAVPLGRSIYVTTAERAKHLRHIRKRLKKKRNDELIPPALINPF